MRIQTSRTLAALGVSVLMASAHGTAETTPAAVQETTVSVRRALERLPYYGVFDFLVFRVNRGTVTLEGYAYQPNLGSDAAAAVKRVPGVDEVANKVVALPASQQDDYVRWATFYRIYTDDFLSRYAPRGAFGARFAAHEFARFPGMQPSGTYPIHIIVKNGHTTLIGVVDNASDRKLVEFRAKEVIGTFAVENEIVTSAP